MKISVVQLSDIHITDESNPILKKVDQIISVLNKYTSNVDHMFLLFTGDIAFSGAKKQYDAANLLIQPIRDKLSQQLPVSIIMVPGNHDCNFEHNDAVRDAVLKSLQQDSTSDGDIDIELINQCVTVQKEFFDFRKQVASKGLVEDDFIWSQYKFDVCGKSIVFDCLNVAWCSRKSEEYGSLLFPYGRYSDNRDTQSDIRLVALHHPVHWLKQDQYRNVRARVRLFGDLVFTGHEHSDSASLIDDSDFGESLLIEAGALQLESDNNKSIFNVIEIDIDKSQYKYDVYEYSDKEYLSKDAVGSWESFKALPTRKKSDFKISEKTCTWLRDVGANFMHPDKTNLSLNDIFIYPDLDDVDNEDGKEKYIISSSILRDASKLECGVLVTGQEKSGKTALLRALYLEFHEQALVPLYVDLKEIAKVTDKKLLSVFKKAVVYQYDDKGAERWSRLSKDKKVLLLDDLDRSRVSDRHRWKILAFAKKYFDKIIITADELFEISEVDSQDMTDQLSGFARYEIQSFGHALRYKLICKWRGIGNDQTVTSTELISKVDNAEKIINTVLGNNLVPRVPLYLLTILQSLESATPTDIKNSAFGHYYQFLITESLGKVKVNPGELDEFFNYFSQLAWLFYNSDKKELNISEIHKFNDVYSIEYTRVDCNQRLDLLTKARLLDKRDSYYSFSYPYILYYFIGKYVSDRIQTEPNIQDLIVKCAQHAYTRENANILLFSIHHQKHDFIIDCLLENIRGLFSENEPVNFEKDTEVFNELVEDTVRLVYKKSDPHESRLAARKQQDVIENGKNDLEVDEELPIDELGLPSKLNKLFKAIDILGQLLKSYYGSIRNERKKEIINDIYSGSLRALKEFLVFLEEHKETLITEVEEFIETKGGVNDRVKREKLAKQFVFNLIGLVAFGCVCKSASATSSTHLFDATAMVVDSDNNLAFRLTSLASKLDMPCSLPFDEVALLSRDTNKNIFAHRLLESIVLKHIYFFKVKETDKQRICSSLGISMSDQHAIDYQSKSEKLLKN